MKQVILTTVLLVSSASGFASDAVGKYKQGDCIIGTDPHYSWNGQIAAVEAYSEISGFFGPKYILNFPKYKSSAVVFDKDIEAHSTQIGDNFCRNL